MITCACILWTKKKDVTKNLLLERDIIKIKKNSQWIQGSDDWMSNMFPILFCLFVVKHVSKHTGDERGNMLEKSRWPDRGGWVSACGPCLSQIRPEIKPGGRVVGHGQDTLGQRLTCSATWRSGCWPTSCPGAVGRAAGGEVQGSL